MIAKLVTHGRDRPAAVDAMRRALDGFYIRGLNHNVGCLSAIMREPRFAEGRLTTNFVAEQWPDGFHGGDLDPETLEILIAVGLQAHLTVLARDRRISGLFDGGAGLGETWVARLGDHRVRATARLVDGGLDMATGNKAVEVRGAWLPGDHVFDGTVDGRPVIVQTDRRGTAWDLAHAGVAMPVTILSQRADTLLERIPVKTPPDTSNLVLSPMPGMVVDILVGEGDEVKAGEALAIVDAMKMENVLRAGLDGRPAPGQVLDLDGPQVRVEIALARDIGVGLGLVDRVRSGRAHPGERLVHLAQRRQHHGPSGLADQFDQHHAGIRIAAMQHIKRDRMQVADPDLGGHPNLGLKSWNHSAFPASSRPTSGLPRASS
jgi:propionyl-CoA carboxylase alpha chain